MRGCAVCSFCIRYLRRMKQRRDDDAALTERHASRFLCRHAPRRLIGRTPLRYRGRAFGAHRCRLRHQWLKDGRQFVAEDDHEIVADRVLSEKIQPAHRLQDLGQMDPVKSFNPS
jgi:hypothetical protein